MPDYGHIYSQRKAIYLLATLGSPQQCKHIALGCLKALLNKQVNIGERTMVFNDLQNSDQQIVPFLVLKQKAGPLLLAEFLAQPNARDLYINCPPWLCTADTKTRRQRRK